MVLDIGNVEGCTVLILEFKNFSIRRRIRCSLGEKLSSQLNVLKEDDGETRSTRLKIAVLSINDGPSNADHRDPVRRFRKNHFYDTSVRGNNVFLCPAGPRPSWDQTRDDDGISQSISSGSFSLYAPKLSPRWEISIFQQFPSPRSRCAVQECYLTWVNYAGTVFRFTPHLSKLACQLGNKTARKTDCPGNGTRKKPMR